MQRPTDPWPAAQRQTLQKGQRFRQNLEIEKVGAKMRNPEHRFLIRIKRMTMIFLIFNKVGNIKRDLQVL